MDKIKEILLSASIFAFAAAVRIQHALTGGGIAIRIDKPADLRIIVAALEIVEPGVAVVVITAVAQRVDFRHGARGRHDIAIGIILIAGNHSAAAVDKMHHIAL